jgi:hypothetical protein
MLTPFREVLHNTSSTLVLIKADTQQKHHFDTHLPHLGLPRPYLVLPSQTWKSVVNAPDNTYPYKQNPLLAG